MSLDENVLTALMFISSSRHPDPSPFILTLTSHLAPLRPLRPISSWAVASKFKVASSSSPYGESSPPAPAPDSATSGEGEGDNPQTFRTRLRRALNHKFKGVSRQQLDTLLMQQRQVRWWC